MPDSDQRVRVQSLPVWRLVMFEKYFVGAKLDQSWINFLAIDFNSTLLQVQLDSFSFVGLFIYFST